MASVEGLELDLTLGEGGIGQGRRRTGAMRILVLGDFTGRAARGGIAADPPIRERPILRVDVDNFEGLLRRLAPKLGLSALGEKGGRELELRSLDDFRPERLFERVSVFRELREIRKRLLDPMTLEFAAAELRALLGGPAPDVEAMPSVREPRQEALGESDAQAIERLLGRAANSESAARRDRPDKAREAVSELIRRAVAPHLVPEKPPHADVYLSALDEAVGERLRSLLHAPAFQALEARWRSLHQLVTGLETDEDLQVFLLDLSREELEADLAAAGGDLKASGIYRLLVEEAGVGTPGGEPWSLLVGSFEVGLSAADLGLLAALGVIAASAGGPFLAAARPELLGCPSGFELADPSSWGPLPQDAEAAWNALRRTPIAPWIGLALPRVLLRLPYSKDSDPVEGLDFEELVPERRHEDYLWGNPAVLCALLIGQAYSARGWAMAPGEVRDVGDLPAHVYEAGGEKRLQACAEVYLTERAASAIVDRGIMPLLSFKGRNLVRLVRFQSIASPPAALMGSWEG